MLRSHVAGRAVEDTSIFSSESFTLPGTTCSLFQYARESHFAHHLPQCLAPHVYFRCISSRTARVFSRATWSRRNQSLHFVFGSPKIFYPVTASFRGNNGSLQHNRTRCVGYVYLTTRVQYWRTPYPCTRRRGNIVFDEFPCFRGITQESYLYYLYGTSSTCGCKREFDRGVSTRRNFRSWQGTRSR